MKWLLIGSLFIAGGGGVVAWQFLPAEKRLRSDSPTESGASSGCLEVQGIGYVEPVSEVRKLAFQQGGVVRRCYVQPGDLVRRGDPLMDLDDVNEKASVAVARAQRELVQAEAAQVSAGVNPHRIHAAERTVERMREQYRHYHSEAGRLKNLSAQQAVSNQELAAAETQRDQAAAALREQEAELLHLKNHVTQEQRAMLEARVRQAEVALEQMEVRLGDTRLVAPFDGTVLKLLKREGEGVRMIEPEPVLLFGDLSRLRVRAEIDERFVRGVAVGQKAVVSGRNLGENAYRGRVVQLERIMGDKTVFTRASSERKDLDVLQLLIEMDPDFQVPIGLQVDVRIEGTLDGKTNAER